MSEQKPFDPFAPKKYRREEVEKIFGPQSSLALAMRLKKENLELYREIRQAAVQHGILAPENKLTPTPIPGRRMFKPTDSPGFVPTPVERRYTSEELETLARFSEAEVKEFFQQTSDGPPNKFGTVADVAKSKPQLFEHLRQAGVLRGLLDERKPRVKPPKPTPESDGRVTLAPEFCDRAGLPRNYRVTADEFVKIRDIIAEAEAAKAEQAAREKAKAE